MFDIEYKGGNTVVFSTKKATLVVDPKLSVVGLKDYPTKAAIVLATEPDFCIASEDALLTVDGPGEYEASDFSVRGIAVQRHIDTPQEGKKGTMYRIEIGDTRIAVLGNLDDNLSEEQLEELGVIDLMVVPVGGGGYTLDAVKAAKLVRTIEPTTIIPVHYAGDGATYEVSQDELDPFVKELGAEVEETAKYKVKSQSALPVAKTIIKLTRS